MSAIQWVCVTGGSGFLGSHVVKQLLEKEYGVHATVRDATNVAKVKHLLSLEGATDRLRLYDADLTKVCTKWKGSFYIKT